MLQKICQLKGSGFSKSWSLLKPTHNCMSVLHESSVDSRQLAKNKANKPSLRQIAWSKLKHNFFPLSVYLFFWSELLLLLNWQKITVKIAFSCETKEAAIFFQGKHTNNLWVLLWLKHNLYLLSVYLFFCSEPLLPFNKKLLQNFFCIFLWNVSSCNIPPEHVHW